MKSDVRQEILCANRFLRALKALQQALRSSYLKILLKSEDSVHWSRLIRQKIEERPFRCL
ncbi:MAG: hypothetical protein BA066_03110 [Candidatus Korarchaeota archaeon NZ13-K]|nr:MAG: hypothetical protein BA066_03110 [Candidatus Korarchaeota archaeon NZ13-K]